MSTKNFSGVQESPISQWVRENQDKDLTGWLKFFYKLCVGKKVKLDGVRYTHGKELIDVFKKYIKVNCEKGYKLDNWVSEFSERINIDQETIRNVLKFGPRWIETTNKLREIEKPKNIGIEKVVSLRDMHKKLRKKEAYIEDNIEQKERESTRGKNKSKDVIRTLYEYWPLEKTEKLCRDTPRDPKSWVLHDVIRNAQISEDGLYYVNKVQYRYSIRRDEGRLYSDGASFQSLKGSMRRIMCNSDHPNSHIYQMRDIDISNCFPTLLYQICLRYGVELNIVKEYMNRRDELLDEAMRLYGVSKKLAKSIFLIEMHGGSFMANFAREYNMNMNDIRKVDFPFIVAFRNEIERAYNHLSVLEDFKTIFEDIKIDEEKSNKKGTFISVVCQNAENIVINACCDITEGWGYHVETLVFDGYQIDWPMDASDRKHIDMDSYLIDVSRSVLEITGYDLLFTNKSLELESGDLEKIYNSYVKEDFFGKLTTVIEEKDMMTAMVNGIERPIMSPITDDKKVTLVTAGMYLGKSTTTLAYLTEKLKDPKATCIAISVRKQHARTFMGLFKDLNFRHYKDNSTCIDRVVVQYESLHKKLEYILASEIKYDYVIMDESHSIIKNMISQTNGNNLQRNSKTLELILKMSKKVICLDADNQYDASVSEYMKYIFPENQMEHLWYTYNALKRTIVYTDETNFNLVIYDDLINNRNIMIAFRSCERLQAWLQKDIDGEFYINDEGKKVQVKMGVKFGVMYFSKHTTEAELKIFEDINELPDEGLFMAFTSKILVGADILKPFHRVYMDGMGVVGPSARQMIQMLGRARIITTNEIMVNISPPVKLSSKQKVLNYKTLYKNEFRELINQRHIRGEHIQSILDKYDLKWNGDAFEWTPDILLKIYAHQQVECSLDFSQEFHSLIRERGYDVKFNFNNTSIESKLEIKYEHKESLKELRERKNLCIKEALEFVQTMDIRDIEEQCLKLKLHKTDVTQSEQIVNDVLFACRMFPEYYINLDVNLIKYIIKNKSVIYMARAVFGDQDIDLYLKDLVDLSYASIPELKSMTGVYVKRLNRICKLVGFEKGFMCEEKISESALTQNLVKHSDELIKLKKERGYVRNRCTQPISSFRSELRRVGINLERFRVQKGNKKVVSYGISKDIELEKLLPHLKSSSTTNISIMSQFLDKEEKQTSVFDETIPEGLVWKWDYNIPVRAPIDDEKVLGPIKEKQDTPKLDDISAAGIIPWTVDKNGNRLVLLQKMSNGQIQDLGGKIEGKETYIQGAYREMLEESNNMATFVDQSKLDHAPVLVNGKYAVILSKVEYTDELMDIDYGSKELKTGYKRQVKWFNVNEIDHKSLNFRLKKIHWSLKNKIYQQ
jgi:ADP-ribose pyrophosphatase YjhB (NUDIX family)